MAVMNTRALSIGELSRLSGVSPHTLRYYESAGILMPTGRAANGHRRYRREDILWLEFVLRLKLTGMPLAEIRRYAALRAEGDGTLQTRLAMLKLHRQHLNAKLDELAACAGALDDKILTYRKMIAKSRSSARKAAR